MINLLLIKSKALKGDKTAQHRLGWHYHKKFNYKKALYWWKKSGELGGYGKSLFNLGVMHSNGEGVEINQKKSLNYFLQSIKKKHGLIGNAYFCLAGIYRDGKGVRKDIPKAVRFYHLAANRGHLYAEVILGGIYSKNGTISKKYTDLKKSFKYNLIAAKKGFAYCQYTVGFSYLDGVGVKKNFKLASKFLRLAYFNKNAKKHGLDKENLEKLRKINDKMKSLIYR